MGLEGMVSKRALTRTGHCGREKISAILSRRRQLRRRSCPKESVILRGTL
jgi:hypothetical protein